MTGTSAFKDKTLMITGSTGSFGNTVLKHFMNTDLAEIRIFSRDEKKQDLNRTRLPIPPRPRAGIRITERHHERKNYF